ncbi:MAG: hypothetical protein RIQ53_1895 [Pseudomonadota bacterium]|jgi:diguanylate cyclase (GGDEF)-like protein
MSAPVEIILVSRAPAPDLGFSPYGPLILHPVPDLAQLGEELVRQRPDGVVFDCPDASTLVRVAAWPGLAQAALDAAVLVLAPEPALADVLRLLRLGVQDVLPRREAWGLAMDRPLRLAVERKRLEREARKAYASDLATGLPNHAQLMEHMTHLLALREREPAPMAVLLLQLQGLDEATRDLGPEAANVLRRKVAVRLRSGLRASDVVASIGGDAFAVLLAWMDDPKDAGRVAEKLAQLLLRPFAVAGRDLGVSVATGLAQYPQQGKDARELLQRARESCLTAVPRGRLPFGARGTAAPAANDE